MRNTRKEALTYYFSVEGETEQWYLEWLQKKINSDALSKYSVRFDSKVEKDPVSRAKRITVIDKTEITHIVDLESEDPEHIAQFHSTIDSLKDAGRQGKSITYKLGYSNFTFELWLLLHKRDMQAPLTDRKQYLRYINDTFGEHFDSLSQYKREDNFKKILSGLEIDDVKDAIRRAERIMNKKAEDSGRFLREYKGYTYYLDNPSLTVWESIRRILSDCKLI